MPPADRPPEPAPTREDSTAPATRSVALGHGRVHLLEAGRPGAPPLVLLHGASGNARDWQASILPMLARRHHVLALDRPGFGHSAPLPGLGWRLGDQVAALAAALAALGHRRYVLAGHSYGGALALAWTLARPDEVAGLLALGTPAMDWGGDGIGLHYRIGGHPLAGPVLARLARTLATRGYVRRALAEIFAPQAVPAGYAERAAVRLALRPHTFRANAAMMLRLYPQIVAQSRRYGEIACPVEIVHGAADALVPASVHAGPLARLIPGARLTLLPGIGHMPHHGAPGPVIAALDRLAGAAGASEGEEP